MKRSIYLMLLVGLTTPSLYSQVDNNLCPDDQHPHMIDLGLPSGTKWACCNVDATKPEDFGGYYAWGETETKDCYEWETYTYYNDNDGFIFIGDDIAGTQYDVAHVKWGSFWKLPKIDQYKELIDYCTRTEVTRNGTRGLVFTGPNGASIFLPAAGGRIGYEMGDSGVNCWSSTANRGAGSDKAYYYSDLQGWNGYTFRRTGYPVRPVYSIDLSISQNHVIITIGNSTTIDITEGNGNYEISSSNSDIVKAWINGSTITLAAQGLGSAVVTIKDTFTNQTVDITVSVRSAVSYVPAEAIDLGLPSGTLWASWNIGATKPEEYGGYYSWGETEVKDVYDWSNYTYCDGTSESCRNIGDNIAGTEYDVAHVKWGGSWQMPSRTQFDELIKCCSHEWTSENGVIGDKFISKKNGNSIFLPAAGFYWDEDLVSLSEYSYYWSDFQSTDRETHAYGLKSNEENTSTSRHKRMYGFPVRPVCPAEPTLPPKDYIIGNKAFYVYRNDNQFDALFISEVDSIIYSKIDTLGIEREDFVVQEVYTTDSLYRIPLSAIDSVSFFAPDPLKSISEAFVPIDWNKSTLLECDPASGSYKLSYSGEDPAINRGSVVVIDTDTASYVVLVTDVNHSNNQYDIKGVEGDLSYIFSETEFTLTTEQNPSRSDGRRFFMNNPRMASEEVVLRATGELWKGGKKFTFDLYNNDDARAYTVVDFNLNFDYSVTLVFGGKVTTEIDGQKFTKANSFKADACIIGNMSSSYDFYLDIVKEKTKIDLAPKESDKYELLKHNLFPPLKLEFAVGPVPVWIDFGTDLFADVSLFGGGEFHFSTGFEFNSEAKLGVYYDGLNGNLLNGYREGPTFDINPHNPTISGKGELTAKAHLFPRVHAWIWGLGGPSIDIKPFLKFDFGGGYQKDLLDNAQSDYCAWSLEAFCGMDLAVGLSSSNGLYGYETRNVSTPDVTVYEHSLYKTPEKVEFLSAKPDRVRKGEETKVEFEVFDVGFDGKTLPTFLPQLVKFEGDGVIESTDGVFGVASSGVVSASWTPATSRDTLYAKLYNMNGDVISEAKYYNKMPVCITDFKQTGSHYEKDGYTYNGWTYSYEYDVTVIVELDDPEGVADWGYVYEDPNGKIARISLKDFSSPYSDSRYVYYRNEASSTVRLYEYVKYEGSENYEYGEPVDYEVHHGLTTCPDGNHPHMIDLGLPSGTKWACCNVGASSPEQYGGYYAWGETEEKDVYNPVTYKYTSGVDEDGDGWYDDYHEDTGLNGIWQHIGDDIAGTQYDVAHVKWGGSWRMPSYKQQAELGENCSRTWTTQNGVNGMLVTGPNGGTVFLPAAGYRWFDYLYGEGEYGLYWSSSLYPSLEIYACSLLFYSGFWYWGYDDRHGGFSVRAVCP